MMLSLKSDCSYCCVPQCTSSGNDIPRTSFHRFPLNEKSDLRLRQWIVKLRIGKKVTKRMVVCGKHFKPFDFMPQARQVTGSLLLKRRRCLKKTAIPSCNLPTTSKVLNFEEMEKDKELKWKKISKNYSNLGEKKLLEAKIQNYTSDKSSDESTDVPEEINLDSPDIESERHLFANNISSNSIIEKAHECNEELRPFSEDAVTFDYSSYDSAPYDSKNMLRQKLKTMIAFNKILQEKVKIYQDKYEMCEKEVNILKGVVENLKLINSYTSDI